MNVKLKVGSVINVFTEMTNYRSKRNALKQKPVSLKSLNYDLPIGKH